MRRQPTYPDAHPLITRGVYGFGELPDRITLWKLQAHRADVDALRSRVQITLVHEIGHYFGIDDARLRELGWAWVPRYIIDCSSCVARWLSSVARTTRLRAAT